VLAALDDERIEMGHHGHVALVDQRDAQLDHTTVRFRL
jgi:hypothetical protein